jgi:hypothetical protein
MLKRKLRLGRSGVFPLPILAVLALTGAGCGSSSESPNRFKNDPKASALLRERLGDCYSSDASARENPNEVLVVNGYRLSETQTKNVQWVRRCVVPMLPGSAKEQKSVAARNTWWSLREGIFDLDGAMAFRYSNCHEDGQDHSRTNDPLYQCPTSIWQVGFAAGQVANYSDREIDAAKDQVFETLDPSIDEGAILAWTATLAGFPDATKTQARIRRSTGKVRRSWFVRNPIIGFLLVGKQEVTSECLSEGKPWCFGSGYPAAKQFSHNRAAMLQSIADLERIFRE